jgi:hypothetical protein
MLWQPEVHRHVHNSPSKDLNPARILITYLKLILSTYAHTRSSKRSVPVRSLDANSESTSHLCHAYFILHSSPNLFDYPHNTYLLTPWGRALLEKLTCFQLMKKFPAFMEPEGSLPPSEVPATCPYPEPARSSPYPHILIPITLIIFCENGGLKILVAFFR